MFSRSQKDMIFEHEKKEARTVFLKFLTFFRQKNSSVNQCLLAIFWNEITTILTPSTSEGGDWGGGGDHVFHFGGP